MTPLPPNPTPTEVHVRLLTLMGWTDIGPSLFMPSRSFGHYPDFPENRSLVPEFDDNLLRLCRERLLTTEELWEAYLEQLQIGGSEFENLQSVLETLVLTHAIAICRAVEKGEA